MWFTRRFFKVSRGLNWVPGVCKQRQEQMGAELEELSTGVRLYLRKLLKQTVLEPFKWTAEALQEPKILGAAN